MYFMEASYALYAYQNSEYYGDLLTIKKSETTEKKTLLLVWLFFVGCAR